MRGADGDEVPFSALVLLRMLSSTQCLGNPRRPVQAYPGREPKPRMPKLRALRTAVTLGSPLYARGTRRMHAGK